MSYFWGPSQSFKGHFVNITYNDITIVSKFAGPAGPPSVNFEGPQAILQAIDPRARRILTPVSQAIAYIHAAEKVKKLYISISCLEVGIWTTWVLKQMEVAYVS